jgi:hypothetical protein
MQCLHCTVSLAKSRHGWASHFDSDFSKVLKLYDDRAANYTVSLILLILIFCVGFRLFDWVGVLNVWLDSNLGFYGEQLIIYLELLFELTFISWIAIIVLEKVVSRWVIVYLPSFLSVDCVFGIHETSKSPTLCLL